MSADACSQRPLRKAIFFQNHYKIDIQLAREDPSTETIAFNLKNTTYLFRVYPPMLYFVKELGVNKSMLKLNTSI